MLSSAFGAGRCCAGPSSRVLPARLASTAATLRRGGVGERDQRRRDAPIFNPTTAQPFQQDETVTFRPTREGNNVQIATCADRHDLLGAISLTNHMKESGIKPDIFTYHSLLRIFAYHGTPYEAVAYTEELLSMGIEPKLRTFNYALEAIANSYDVHTDNLWPVLEWMRNAGFQPDAMSSSRLLRIWLRTGNVEMALQTLGEMSSSSFMPDVETMQDLIALVARQGHSRLGIDLAESFDGLSTRKLDTETWVALLDASADALFAEGVEQCWGKVVTTAKLLPDEGTCIQVLNTAGRHGLAELAADVLRVLLSSGAVLAEHHMAPCIEAFCQADRLRDALSLLFTMRKYSVEPTEKTAWPILETIRSDPARVEEAFNMLQNIHKEGSIVDVTAYNIVLQASITQGDLQRAISIYKVAPELNVQRSIDTYNILLVGCIAASHRPLGDRILNEMKDARVKPNAVTFERLIQLCLTQDDYEDAFFYLEEMKAQKHKPSYNVYDAIIRKCISMGDDRYRIAVDEMKELQYEITPSLRQVIEKGGQAPADPIPPPP